MQHIEETAERIRQSLDAVTAARDKALTQTRMLTRHSAQAVRAIHRDEDGLAQQNLEEARRLVKSLREDLASGYRNSLSDSARRSGRPCVEEQNIRFVGFLSADSFLSKACSTAKKNPRENLPLTYRRVKSKN